MQGEREGIPQLASPPGKGEGDVNVDRVLLDSFILCPEPPSDSDDLS